MSTLAHTLSADSGQKVIIETATADLYTLLALLLQFPTEDSVKNLAENSPGKDLEAIASELGQEAARFSSAAGLLCRTQSDLASQATSYSEVRREYSRLFNHPEKPVVPLYEGVFIDREREREGKPSTGARLFINPAALDAERCYRQAGLTRSNEINIPADCMTTELEFMAHLHTLRAQALIDGEAGRIDQADAWIAEFERIHLLKWFSRFFELCASESRHTLYQAVGEMGMSFMKIRGIAGSDK